MEPHCQSLYTGAMTEPTSHENRAPLVSNLADSIFVGRQREMDELQTILQDALAGRGQMVMLTGEPGIGKTRVAQELAAAAQFQGVRVLWG